MNETVKITPLPRNATPCEIAAENHHPPAVDGDSGSRPIAHHIDLKIL